MQTQLTKAQWFARLDEIGYRFADGEPDVFRSTHEYLLTSPGGTTAKTSPADLYNRKKREEKIKELLKAASSEPQNDEYEANDEFSVRETLQETLSRINTIESNQNTILELIQKLLEEITFKPSSFVQPARPPIIQPAARIENPAKSNPEPVIEPVIERTLAEIQRATEQAEFARIETERQADLEDDERNEIAHKLFLKYILDNYRPSGQNSIEVVLENLAKGILLPNRFRVCNDDNGYDRTYRHVATLKPACEYITGVADFIRK